MGGERRGEGEGEGGKEEGRRGRKGKGREKEGKRKGNGKGMGREGKGDLHFFVQVYAPVHRKDKRLISPSPTWYHQTTTSISAWCHSHLHIQSYKAR